jgi:hypothetical protein
VTDPDLRGCCNTIECGTDNSLQVFTTNFVLAGAQSLPPYDDDPPWPYGQALSRIWPVKQPVVHWPPSQHVTTRVFDKLVNWGQFTVAP